MKRLLFTATLAAACVLLPAQARETPLEQALRAAERMQAAPMILAQADRPRPTCKNDGKEMPRGSIVCYDGKLLQCGPRGTWEDTRKPC
jgi:hypothetical protein